MLAPHQQKPVRQRATLTLGLRRVSTGLVFLLLAVNLAAAAGGNPQLAVVRATPHRSASGAGVTLEVEASFNFDDALQLPLPVHVIVTQGSLSARFDLAGNVFTSVGGGAEQSSPGPGVIAVTRHVILLVLPSAFAQGPAAVQLVVRYRDEPFSSNRLDLTL